MSPLFLFFLHRLQKNIDKYLPFLKLLYLFASTMKVKWYSDCFFDILSTIGFEVAERNVLLNVVILFVCLKRLSILCPFLVRHSPSLEKDGMKSEQVFRLPVTSVDSNISSGCIRLQMGINLVVKDEHRFSDSTELFLKSASWVKGNLKW